MTDYEALAQRVEREEPSRELDAAIARAIGWRPEDPRDAPDDWTAWIDPQRPGRIVIPRHWTRSLDAAASLVPPGWWIDAIHQMSNDKMYVLLDSMDGPVEATAPTEPRARTAAALRAMAMEAKDE